MVNSCPTWLRYCAKGKDWDTALLAAGSALMLAQFLFSAALLILTATKKQSADSRRQLWIAAFLCATGAIRAPWWWMNAVVFEDNSAPAIWIQVLNRAAFLSVYLAQSFYIQTWLRVVLLLSKRGGSAQLRICFVVLDLLVSAVILFAIVTRFFDKTTGTGGHSYGLLYSVSTYLPASASLLLSLVFAGLGGFLVIGLRRFYSACSWTIAGFFVVSTLLAGAAVCRFLGLFYNKFFGAYLPGSAFAALAYFVPDVVPCLTLSAVQVQIYRKAFVQERFDPAQSAILDVPQSV